jgi:hypothetical protein
VVHIRGELGFAAANLTKRRSFLKEQLSQDLFFYLTSCWVPFVAVWLDFLMLDP